MNLRLFPLAKAGWGDGAISRDPLLSLPTLLIWFSAFFLSNHALEYISHSSIFSIVSPGFLNLAFDHHSILQSSLSSDDIS